MNLKKRLLSVVCSISVLSSIGISYAVTNLTQKDKVAVYENLFDKDLYLELFNDRPNMLQMNNHKIGVYRANMKLLFEDVSMSSAFRKFSKNEEAMYAQDRFAKYSGIPAIQKGKEDAAFKYYNPDFIKWCITNFYIEPATEIYGIKAQDIYDKSFKDFFRITASSYVFLNKKKGYYKAEQKSYLDAYNAGMREKNPVYFDGPFYLYERYNKIEKKELKDYYKADFSYDPSTAMGFWVRRGIDKTDKVIWGGIKKVMSNYDKEWFKKNNK